MTPGERAALEGVLAQVRPKLAVEIGTAEGGSLRLIARYSAKVLSFDLVEPELELEELPNVALHTGDSHELLPRVLSELAADGTNVDFVLVDGDHTADGVERDVRDLVTSDAVRDTVIVFHDTMNDDVRAGIERIDPALEPKIRYVDLDFVAGRLNHGGAFHHQLWGGLGLMIIQTDASRMTTVPAADGAYSAFELIAPVRDALRMHEEHGARTGPGHVREALAARDSTPPAQVTPTEVLELRAALADSNRRLQEIATSKSWRFTAPLRMGARMLRRRRNRGRS